MFLSRFYYKISALVAAVFISGLIQGMLLPLLAVIFEKDGVSPALNGLNAAGLYIGIMLASPFMEKPLHKFGYKPVILAGLAGIIVAVSLFPVLTGYWWWFALRLVIGFGDNMLHFGAQIWITLSSPKNKRGKFNAFYGLAFGLGFACGPLAARLLSAGLWVPFTLTAVAGAVVFLAALYLKNEHPDSYERPGTHEKDRFTRRAWALLKLGWAGLLATFGYGFLEASLNGSFPIVALRAGYDLDQIAWILPSFVAGGLFTQIPLGMISDRFGRRSVLASLTLAGALCFFASAFLLYSFFGMVATFVLAGACLGSLYSMGMTYISDIVPARMLPIGNILGGITFGIGSMSGPYIAGLFIGHASGAGFFIGIFMFLLLIFIGLLFSKKSRSPGMSGGG